MKRAPSTNHGVFKTVEINDESADALIENLSFQILFVELLIPFI